MRIRNPASRVFTLDPGVRGCGLAYYVDRVLWAAWYLANPDEVSVAGAAAVAMGFTLRANLQGYVWDAAVVEWPKQYEGESHHANREDISDLTGVAAVAAFVFAERCNEIHTPLPFEWKGQVPKHMHTARVVGAQVGLQRLPKGPKGWVSSASGVLTAEEVGRIRWTSRKDLNHNIVDAAGIGLKYVGRM